MLHCWRGQAGMKAPISVTRDLDNIKVEVSLIWSADSYADTLLGYANWCVHVAHFRCKKNEKRKEKNSCTYPQAFSFRPSLADANQWYLRQNDVIVSYFRSFLLSVRYP